MRIVDKVLPPAASFQRQLFVTMAVGLVLLALTSSITTAWLASRNARQNLVLQGQQVTENFGRQSILALLYGSPGNAADSAAATLAFPDVDYVSIIDLNRKVLLERGSKEDKWLPPKGPYHDGAVLGRETDGGLDFYSPVYTLSAGGADSRSPFETHPPRRELLGTVHVHMSKASLIRAQHSIFFDNVVLSLACAAVLLIFLMAMVRRITTPVQDLSQIMAQAEADGDPQIRARVGGPLEIHQMAQAFNKMMGTLAERDLRLRRHRDMLETEVVLRTQELVQARDEALRASRHKSEFLANMSHELRTPMNAIIGYTEMVMEDLEAAGNRGAVTDLKRVKNASRHLLSLINSVLDLSKIEAGRMDLWLETVSLSDLLDQVRDSVEPMITRNNNRLEIKTEITEDTIDIDPGKLRQILLNLLSNAAKFTQDGRIEMSITRDDHVLIAEVNDTGIGIPKDQQGAIFEAFRQLDMSITRDFGGTGLGLGISQRYCRLMGGDITVDSEEGKGSTFTAMIPLPVSDPDEDAPGTGVAEERPLYTSSADRQGPAQSASILIIDDDADFIDIQTRALQRSGFRVYVASAAKDLLGEIRRLRPDALILDIFLSPPNDGWVLLSQIRNDPATQDIPVIVVSAVDERSRAMDMGAEEFLAKPVDRAELVVVVQEICTNQRRIPKGSSLNII